MNWLINILHKEARRFQPGNIARYYSRPPQGMGKGVVHQPSFRKGRVVSYDSDTRRYLLVDNNSGEEIRVHPRNMVPDSVSPATDSNPEPVFVTEETTANTV